MPKKFLVVFLPIILYFSFLPLNPAYAQFGSSNCVITRVGNAAACTTLSPECLGGVGAYTFALNISQVTGIATEMAAYPGGYAYQGHREHAGLDIGTPIAGHAPVYAVTNGVVSNCSSWDNCDRLCSIN